MTSLKSWILRGAALALTAGAGACVCVPTDSEAAQRGYATVDEYLDCRSLSSFDSADPADCYDVGEIDWPLTGVLWSRTIWVVSSEDDGDTSGEYEPPSGAQ